VHRSKDSPPIFCYVTDRRGLPGFSASAAFEDSLAALLASVTAAAAAGISWIQIREKDLSAKDCSLLVRAALASGARSPSPPRIMVNDRLDVALAERAQGVHLGEHSVPAREARRLLDELRAAPALSRASSFFESSFLADFTVGVSCHSVASAKAAARSADYIFFGPVFATPSKAGYGPPQGLARLTEVCRAVAVPVLAIGGITALNAPACLRAGASGIAAIRLFQDSRDLSAVIDGLAHSSRERGAC
jgi:thiamine-phosphate pyrophosphorylase